MNSSRPDSFINEAKTRNQSKALQKISKERKPPQSLRKDGNISVMLKSSFDIPGTDEHGSIAKSRTVVKGADSNAIADVPTSA